MMTVVPSKRGSIATCLQQTPAGSGTTDTHRKKNLLMNAPKKMIAQNNDQHLYENLGRKDLSGGQGLPDLLGA
jgi:hypothetical protein